MMGEESTQLGKNLKVYLQSEHVHFSCQLNLPQATTQNMYHRIWLVPSRYYLLRRKKKWPRETEEREITGAYPDPIPVHHARLVISLFSSPQSFFLFSEQIIATGYESATGAGQVVLASMHRLQWNHKQYILYRCYKNINTIQFWPCLR